VETLQKAMVVILKSQQLRDVLVYTTLLLVFATAWVIYRWPDMALPAVVVTGVLLGGEALLIYLAVKRLRHPQH
jgi:multisubunit Na+/H+ antiporter MnhB subunit